jgi:hypothetical protein
MLKLDLIEAGRTTKTYQETVSLSRRKVDKRFNIEYKIT